MRLTPVTLVLILILGVVGALIAVTLPELQRYLKIRSM
jgi:hypothetical protein